MESKPRIPIMIQGIVPKRGRFDKFVFWASHIDWGDKSEFILETSRTFLSRKRFAIIKGCKITCGDKSYVVTLIVPDKFGPPDCYAQEIAPNQEDIEELKILSTRLA